MVIDSLGLDPDANDKAQRLGKIVHHERLFQRLAREFPSRQPEEGFGDCLFCQGSAHMLDATAADPRVNPDLDYPLTGRPPEL